MTTLHTSDATSRGSQADGSIRWALPREVPHIAEALGRAFFADPVMRWAIPDDDRRRRALPAFFELFTTTVQRHDEVLVAGNTAGAGLWVPPGQQAIDDD